MVPDDPLDRLDLAVTALAAWQADRGSPREAIARHVPRATSAADRAEIAEVVYGAIRGQRRHEWLLPGTIVATTGRPRAAALVLAECVATGRIEVPAAQHRATRFGLSTVDFEGVALAESRLATVADNRLRFALRHSIPDWLAQLLADEYGDAADAVARSLNAVPPRTVRANRLRVATRQALAAALAEQGIASSPTRFAGDGLVVAGDASLFDTQQYRDGAFEQQDEGSQLVALAVAPPPRGRVLDACAGSGGKALALAAMLANAGTLLAIDVSPQRVATLQQRARRAGAHNLRAEVTPPDRWPDAVSAFAARADRILLDVPCSGTGSWRRRPEARWVLAPEDLAALRSVQQQLLDRAIAQLQPGARIVYATCSLLAVENEAQVAAALERHPEIEPVRLAEVLGGAAAAPIADTTGTWLQLLPHRHGTDGFFAAILRRRRR